MTSVSLALALAANVSPCGAQTFPAVIELSSLQGPNGFVLRGTGERDFLGFRMSRAGDINGDGIGDIVVAKGGGVYVLFGTNAGFPAAPDLSALDGDNGFVVEAYASVGAAGDVNGNGIDDLIIGSFDASPGGKRSAGTTYVVFGHTGVFPARLDPTNLDGSNGFAMNGVDSGDHSGWSVGGGVDVTGDGIDDMITGAYTADPIGRPDGGEAYVVFGRIAPFPAVLELSALNGANGFVARAAHPYDMVGIDVDLAADINGDGIGDIMAAAPALLSFPPRPGAAYVVFGSHSGFPAVLNLANLGGGIGFSASDGKRLTGSAGGAGDVNGDGIADFVVGGPYADANGNEHAGASYVVFGNAAGFPDPFDLTSLDGTNGFVARGIHAHDSAAGVSGAGDVNGDGLADVIIGASSADPDGKTIAGESYVVFGRNSFPAEIDLSDLNGTNGFVLRGIHAFDQSGASTAGAGDVNGDGLDDFMIAAPGADDDIGEVYVVFGCNSSIDEECDGVADGDDNCTLVSNPDQRDTDGDGIGNVCDADFDQDCMQNFSDLAVMKQNFFVAGDLNTDINGDGFTNFVDLGALKRGFFQPPGPSGVANLCDGVRSNGHRAVGSTAAPDSATR